MVTYSYSSEVFATCTNHGLKIRTSLTTFGLHGTIHTHTTQTVFGFWERLGVKSKAEVCRSFCKTCHVLNYRYFDTTEDRNFEVLHTCGRAVLARHPIRTNCQSKVGSSCHCTALTCFCKRFEDCRQTLLRIQTCSSLETGPEATDSLRKILIFADAS